MHAATSYLALGDSYTIGEALAVHDSWPMQWAHALRADGRNTADPVIIAKTGWSTDELALALDEADTSRTIAPPYGRVSLCIGVNNQYRGRSAENYREEFAALLRRALAYSGNRPAHVFVLSIPDWGLTEFGRNSGRDTTKIAGELDAYNRINAELSRQAGVHWVDIARVTRDAGSDARYYTDDGLHPSRALYALWVKELLKITE